MLTPLGLGDWSRLTLCLSAPCELHKLSYTNLGRRDVSYDVMSMICLISIKLIIVHLNVRSMQHVAASKLSNLWYFLQVVSTTHFSYGQLVNISVHPSLWCVHLRGVAMVTTPLAQAWLLKRSTWPIFLKPSMAIPNANVVSSLITIIIIITNTCRVPSLCSRPSLWLDSISILSASLKCLSLSWDKDATDAHSWQC